MAKRKKKEVKKRAYLGGAKRGPKPKTIINGMEFEKVEGARYMYAYERLVKDLREKKDSAYEVAMFRDIIQNDLWFIVYFILKIPIANHPFIVNTCREVVEGPATNTLDLYAREHFKSTIFTIAETIQDICKNPNSTICILSYARAAALTFLRNIKNVLESSQMLKSCFPDIFYRDPAKQAFRWSEEAGLYVQRDTFRKEATVEAWGLIDGQPTGRHYDKLVYDDVVTDEVSRSPEMISKVKRAFDMSNNLGVATGGRRRVIGTFYHHDDPLVYIQGLVDRKTDEPVFTTRIKPATEDGEPNGVPVYLTEERMSELRSGDPYIFNCQQLLNPTPVSEIPLSPDCLVEVEPNEIPKRLFKFMTVDPAGMETKTKKRGDAWSLIVAGVVPHRDDIGASDLYILDMMVEPMSEVESMDNVVDVYSRNGRILKLGVEKVGMTTMEIHIANALRNKGVYLSIETGNLVVLRPGGRAKQTRIERNLAWPLLNGKIKISKAIPAAYRERLRIEMEKFPYWHDDALDGLSYMYDIMKDYTFGPEPPEEEDVEEDMFDRYTRRYEEKFGKELEGEFKWMTV